ncbi:MAG TPA: NAD(P)H-dependent oxidoreductase [Jatrophihabitantaceae bacterium]|jgi:NAD(P)H-dependent FMN reductase
MAPDPTTAPRLQVVIGSTRPGRAGAAVGRWFAELAGKHGGFAVEVLDLAEIDLPLLDEPHPPRTGRYQHEHTKRWSRLVSRGDAYVFVVPEYNHGYNAATKNALDYLCEEWRRKPVGFVGYGMRAGGARAVQMLLQVVTALGMVPVSESVVITHVRRMLTEDGGLFMPDAAVERAAEALLGELDEWATDLAVLPKRAARRSRR